MSFMYHAIIFWSISSSISKVIGTAGVVQVGDSSDRRLDTGQEILQIHDDEIDTHNDYQEASSLDIWKSSRRALRKSPSSPSFDTTTAPTMTGSAAPTTINGICDLLHSTGGVLEASGWTCSTENLPITTPCIWLGVLCNNENTVIHLQLSDLSLTGSLPHSLGTLTSITAIDMNTNSLTGTIPSNLFNISLLHYLDLSNNQLSGRIPTELIFTTSLESIQLHHNSLTGPLPTELFSLLLLTKLSLETNLLSGTLSDTFYQLTNLKYMSLTHNQFNGTISSSIGSLIRLETFQINQNDFTGTLPSSIINLSNLNILNIANNYISGSIPSNIGHLVHLNELLLARNHFTGSIPTSLFQLSSSLSCLNLVSNSLNNTISSEFIKLSKLITLELGDNSFTGTLPDIFEGLLLLTKLSLELNNIIGTIPSSLGFLSNLIILQLDMNNLKGTVPSELGSLTNLTTLDLSLNELTGVIPPSFSQLISLKVLKMSSNALQGSLSSVLFQLKSLILLSLSDNYFTGIIPSTLADLTDLGRLFLGRNSLVGELPTTLSTMDLFMFRVPNNFIEGTIPTFFGILQSLRSLDISENNFIGTIPTQLGLLSKLAHLDMGYNYLIGVIPTELETLQSLKRIHMSGNGLIGTIPVWIADISKLRSLTLNNNYLTGTIPEALYDRRRLSTLILSNNLLTGTIISNLKSMRTLRYMYLSSNDMTGIIPQSFCSKSSLKDLRLIQNQFTCYHECLINQTIFTTDFRKEYTVCTSTSNNIGNYSGSGNLGNNKNQLEIQSITNKIITLETSINAALCDLLDATGGVLKSFGWKCRSGEPYRLCQLAWEGVTCDSSEEIIEKIDLKSFNLEGTLPESLGLLTTLTALDLSQNSFTGYIPTTFGYLTEITKLDLGYNSLSGTIPTALLSAVKIQKLNLYHNNFIGQLPSSINNLQQLTYIRITDNNLDCYDPELIILDTVNNDIISSLSVCSNLINDVIITDNVYTEYSTCSYEQNPSSYEWNNRDFCTFYQQYQCSTDVISNYIGNGEVTGMSCPPACLSAPATFCTTFALFVIGCGVDTGQTYDDANQLANECINSYTTLLITETELSLSMDFNITGIDLTAMEAALADEELIPEVYALILTALSASSSIEISAFSITDILLTPSEQELELEALMKEGSVKTGIATVSMDVKSTAEASGLSSDSSHISILKIKKELDYALENEENVEEGTPFIQQLQQLSHHDINGYYVLRRRKVRPMSILSGSSFVTSNVGNSNPGRLRGAVSFVKTASPTSSSVPTEEPTVAPSSPTVTPSLTPTRPTVSPSEDPTHAPSVSQVPTRYLEDTDEPTHEPSAAAITNTPSLRLTDLTLTPSYATHSPTSKLIDTDEPTHIPSITATTAPSHLPLSKNPSSNPIHTPLAQPCSTGSNLTPAPTFTPYTPLKTAKPSRRPHYVHRVSRSPSFGPHRRTRRPPRPTINPYVKSSTSNH